MSEPAFTHPRKGNVCFVERQVLAYVWGMYIRPDRQRRGISTALIRQAVQRFTSAEWVDLSTVDDKTLAAISAFSSKGPVKSLWFQSSELPRHVWSAL